MTLEHQRSDEWPLRPTHSSASLNDKASARDDDAVLDTTDGTTMPRPLSRGLLFVPFSRRLGVEAYWGILLNCLVIFVLIISIPVNIPITSFNTVLSNTGRNVYTAGTTVLGGAVAAFIAGNIKELWFHDIVWIRGLRRHVVPEKYQRRAADRNREARSTVALGSYQDKLLYWPQTVSLLITGLVATCIVTGLAPNVTVMSQTAPEWGLAYYNDSCTIFHNSTSAKNHGQLLFNWTQPDNTWIGSTVGPSPSTMCGMLMAYLSSWYAAMEPDRGIAYETDGMAVRSGAIGMPTFGNMTSSYPPQQLPYFSNMWSYQGDSFSLSSLLGAGQATGSQACLPVMARNPVTCTGTRNTFVSLADGSSVAVGSNGCNATFKPGSLRTGNVCTNNHHLGTASFVVGEIFRGNNRWVWSTTGSRDDSRSVLLADLGHATPSQLLPDDGGFNYTISCEIDVRSAIDFRSVRLDYLGQINGESPLQQLNISKLPGLAPDNSLSGALTQYVLSGSIDTCTPQYSDGTVAKLDQFVFPAMLAEVTSAPWNLLNEYIQTNPGIESQLEYLTEPYLPGTQPGSIQGLYNESKSALEDILGAAHGIALGIYATEASASCYWSDLELCIQDVEGDTAHPLALVAIPAAQMYATYMTVGIGNLWGLIFIVPELYAIALLVWLLRRRHVYLKSLKKRSPHLADEGDSSITAFSSPTIPST